MKLTKPQVQMLLLLDANGTTLLGNETQDIRYPTVHAGCARRLESMGYVQIFGSIGARRCRLTAKGYRSASQRRARESLASTERK